MKDGLSTLTDFTATIIYQSIIDSINLDKDTNLNILICGGGRKNEVLLESIKQHSFKKLILKSIDNFGVDGDFVESQAFAFLAIRSIKKLPISFQIILKLKQLIVKKNYIIHKNSIRI